MAINIPIVNHPAAQTAWQILQLERSQLSLPESPEIMKGALVAYALTQFGAQALNHSLLGSAIYGLASAAIAYGTTLVLLRYLKQEDKFVRTTMAIAGGGALAAFAYIVLHGIFALALPPPLPTERLLRFLLFPIIVWIAFLLAFFYRHVGLRPIPAFVGGSFYALTVEIFLAAVCV